MLRIKKTSSDILSSEPEDLRGREKEKRKPESSSYNESLMKILVDVLKTIMGSN